MVPFIGVHLMEVVVKTMSKLWLILLQWPKGMKPIETRNNVCLNYVVNFTIKR